MNTRATASDRSVSGTLALVVAVVLFSTIEIASKDIQKSGVNIDAFILVFIRFFITGLILLGLGLPSRVRQGLSLGVRDYGMFMLNGVLGIGVAISLFHMSIMVFRNASSSAVVFSANPVFVAALAPFINKEMLGFKHVCAVFLGALGILCFAFESGHMAADSLWGMLLMLASAFFFALSVCISKRIIPRYGPLVLMGFSALFGSLVVLPIGLMRSEPGIMEDVMKAWGGVLYIAVAGTALAYGLYYYGLGKTSAYRASMTFFLKPVLAMVLAIMLRGEQVNRYTVGGTVMILLGLTLALAVKSRVRVTGDST